jgi:hypothetical protein
MQYEYTAKDVKRFWGKVSKTNNSNECWNWIGGHQSQGYGMVWMGIKMNLSHRIAYELTFGKTPDGLDVLHTCDNPSCCNPSHLFLGTHLDNMIDKQQKKRCNSPRGQENGRCKLTDVQVDEIRQLYSTGNESQYTLGKKFGVDPSHIFRLVNYKQRL